MPESKYAYDEESVMAIIEWAQTAQFRICRRISNHLVKKRT